MELRFKVCLNLCIRCMWNVKLKKYNEHNNVAKGKQFPRALQETAVLVTINDVK